MAGVPAPRRRHAPRALPRAGRERDDDLPERPAGELEHGHRAARHVVVLLGDPQLVTQQQLGRVGGSSLTGGRGLPVADPGRRGDHDPRPGDLGAPAQVDVLAEAVDGRVVAAERPEQVVPDQRAAAGDGEDLTDLVVLGLVELARLDARHRRPEAIDPEADLQQAVRLVPLDVLRPDDARIGAVGLLHQPPHGVRGRGDVVVADEQVGGALGGAHDGVGCGGEAAPLLDAVLVGVRQHGGDAALEGRRAAVVDDQHVEIGVVLAGQRREPVLEPRSRVGGDHNGYDRWGLLLRHQACHATAPSDTPRSARPFKCLQ